MAETFQLPEGIAIDDVSGLKSAYTDNGDGNISAVVSAEKLCGLIAELTALLPEPAFFFIELPCDAEEEKSSAEESRITSCTILTTVQRT